jgi:hypothetical protein
MFKVGDEVISKEFGNGVVTAKASVGSLDANPWFGGSYPWAVVFENNKTTRWFTQDGKYVDGSPEDDKYGIKLRYPKKVEATWYDYSFNQSILDALKAGKTVWAKCNCGDKGCEWTEVSSSTDAVLGAAHSCLWSLVKPTTRVKKKLTLYANMMGNFLESYSYTKEKAMSSTTCSTTATAVELTGEYYVEE